MEPMSPASAALLRLETDGSQMHTGWIARLDARTVDLDALRARVARRLETPAAARFRRVAGSEPVWRDDPAFAVERHVAASPAPVAGDDAALRTAIDRVLAEPLPRDRPLWRVLVLRAAPGGGTATIVALAHRALVEGLDASAPRDLVFDREPAAVAGEARAGTAARRSEPADAALDEFRALRRLGGLDAQRASGAPSARLGSTLRRAAMARMEGLTAAPRSFLDAAPAGDVPRTLVTARLELGRLDRIAQRTATDPHDVELAVVAGALRQVALATRAEPVDLRALVPVDPAGERLLGDAPSAVVTLPVAEPGAAARLALVHAAMDAARGRRGAAGALVARDAPAAGSGGDAGSTSAARGAAPARTPTLLAGPPEELATRLAIGARLCNLTVLRTRGPERPLHVGGAHVRALFSVTPMPEEHALALSALAYGRHLHVAAAADPGAIADAAALPAQLAGALDELDAATAGARTAGRVA